jgi:hypothetical protein
MTYSIDWTSQGVQGITGKTSFGLADKTLDSTTTSITLTGKGVYNYGQIQQENFIKLLESFASNGAPAFPTVGQIWFKADESILYTCVDATNPVVVASPSTKYFSANGKAWMRIGNTSAADISTTLGYTPYNGTTNVNNYITAAGAPLQTVAGRTGNVTLSTSDISGLATYVFANSAVTSVAGRTGNVTLSTSDISGLATFITVAAPVTSVAGKTGAVTLAQADVSGLTTTSAPIFSQVTVDQATIRGARPPVVNPGVVIADGDITISAGKAYMLIGGVWKQIFPAVYS